MWEIQSQECLYDASIFELIKSRCIFNNEKNTSLHKKEFDFHTIRSRDWVHVIPIIKEKNKEELIVVKQFRQGIQDFTLEFPGGILDAGEDAEKAAIRELKEETGYSHKSIYHLASYHPNPAILTNSCHSFVAEVEPQASELSLDETEDIEVSRINLDELLQNPFAHKFSNATLLVSLYMYAAQRQGIYKQVNKY